MRKAIATFGTGPSAELLTTTLPTFTDYAERHGYDVVIGDGASSDRPPAWGKVALLQRLLHTYDFVLWLDADTIILDPSEDILSEVPGDAFQALVVTPCNPGEGSSPCTGVWGMRAGETAQRFLLAVWAQTDLVHHKWWEQAAVMRLLGWTLDVPLAKQQASEWDAGTHVLDETWDMLPIYPVKFSPGRIRHYAGMSHRDRLLDMRTDLAGRRLQTVRGPAALWARFRHRAGVLDRRYRHRTRPVESYLRAMRRK